MKSILMKSIIVVPLALTLLSGRACFAQTASRGELEGRLQNRVIEFYVALSEKKFEQAWNFFGLAMKQDNPTPEAYAEQLRRTIKKFVVRSGTPKIWLSETGKKHRLLGKAITPIEVTTTDGRRTSGEHTTYWVWEQTSQSEPVDWFLALDSMDEKRLGGGRPAPSATFADFVVPQGSLR